MFFYASKFIWSLLTPTNLLMLLLVLGAALLFTRYWRGGRRLVVLTAAGFIILGASPAPRLLLRVLEDRFPIVADDGRPVDGIIVLGGSIGDKRGLVKFTDGASRVTTAVALARRHPDARLVFTGGDSRVLLPQTVTEAQAAQAFFRSMGIPDERVVYEGRSRNTHENALFTKALVSPRPGERWLLVTSAFHMPRSFGTFTKAGFTVEPFPVDFQTDGDALDKVRYFSIWSEGLRLSDLAVKEMAGLLAYRLMGYTDRLIPGPKA